jgi:hypothetical protein
MARWNAPFEVEQLALIARLPIHHGKPPRLMFQATESLFAENHEHFFNSIDPLRKSGGLKCCGAQHSPGG